MAIWNFLTRFFAVANPTARPWACRGPLVVNALQHHIDGPVYCRFFVTIWLMKPADFGYFPRLVSLGHAAAHRSFLRHCISEYSVFPVFRRE